MAAQSEVEDDALEGELNKGALWAVVYGDMMSFLFLFFLIQFVFAVTKDMAKEFNPTLGIVNDKPAVAQELLSKNGIQQIAKLDVQQDRIKLTFLAPILFDEGTAELKPGSLPHLKRLAATLRELPNPIIIEGHTDNTPLGKRLQKETGYKSNWELSSGRAYSVLRLLIEEGIPPARLAATGYGEYRPIAVNDTPEGRSTNRRIELNIMRQEN